MADTTDPFGGLEGADRDAYVAITETLKAYGLESLAPAVLGFIQQGYSSDTINVLLQNTDAYKQRFRANEARRQKGLPVLSPAEYLATERAYRQVIAAAGLPPGFYDEPSDFEKFLANDVSPVEVQERVQNATEAINAIDPNYRKVWEQWYGTGDLVAYMLDADRATQVITRQHRAAAAGAAAQSAGMSISRDLAEQLGSAGVTPDQARQGFGLASRVADNTEKLSAVFGGQAYSDEDAVREVFLQDEQAARRRRRLASQERAAFGGSSNTNSRSLGRDTAGQV